MSDNPKAKRERKSNDVLLVELKRKLNKAIARSREEQTRKKVLYGAALLLAFKRMSERGEKQAAAAACWLKEVQDCITRPADRAFLGLPELPVGVVGPPPANDPADAGGLPVSTATGAGEPSAPQGGAASIPK
jgi:hypothetical protein